MGTFTAPVVEECGCRFDAVWTEPPTPFALQVTSVPCPLHKAAPKLLEYLTTIERLLDGHYEALVPQKDVRASAALELAREAIKEAKGVTDGPE